MENFVNILEYNTHRERMTLPEYGRLVQKLVEDVKQIPDREKRSQQAKAIVRIMEILNPAVHQQENWEHTLWDSLFIMAGYDLDIDAPYPVPQKKELEKAPEIVPVQKKPIKATHYGRNIESIIDLISGKEDGEVKTAMIRDLAIYMRTQYLIWNKDSVSDQTIFNDIEKLSDGRIRVPEGLELTQISKQAVFNRPGIGITPAGQQKGRNGFRRGQRRQRK
ncbi:MAG: DUF4290 domain-containing protein [Bacteroidales bacterium]|nr:DUF4290 domain-containing protein [Candidatus Hennigimonas equi]